MNKYIALLLSALTLTGCLTNPTQQALLNDEKRLIAECKLLLASPELDKLRDKIPIGKDNVTTRFILVDKKVVDSEKPLLLKYADAKDQCTQMGYDFYVENNQLWILPALSEIVGRRLTAFSELYGGRITYGEYNRLSAQSKSLYFNKLEKLRAEQMKLGIAAQRNQLQANQNLISASQQLMAPRPQLQRGMTHTNCRWIGQQLNCTSY